MLRMLKLTAIHNNKDTAEDRSTKTHNFMFLRDVNYYSTVGLKAYQAH